MRDKIVVLGAGGFVGRRMVEFLTAKGHKNVVAVCSNRTSATIGAALETLGAKVVQGDLRDPAQCDRALRGADWVYNFASKVGGIGYIKNAVCESYLSTMINLNVLQTLKEVGTSGYFFASSACVYGTSEHPISEDYHLSPTKGYGEEKEYSEKVAFAFGAQHNIPVYCARFTGIYGPGDDLKGAENRDHAPSALVRKVLSAKASGSNDIAIWGDGEQRRDFLYIDDCVEAAYRLMGCGHPGLPVNVGGLESHTINEMVTMLEDIAAVKLTRFYSKDAPVGVRARQLGMDRLRGMTKWLPMTPLKDGLGKLYRDLQSKS